MSSVTIALVVLACVLGSAVVGFSFNAILPADHLNSDSRDSLKATIGVVGTLTALVLGLLIGTAKTSYDAKSDGLTQITTDIILLDRVLAQYGPDAAPARAYLRESATRRLNALWGDAGFRKAMVSGGESTAIVGTMERALRELNPAGEKQRSIQKEALDLNAQLTRALLLTLAHAGGSIPTAFLFVLVVWMCIMFAGIGLITPRNVTARSGVIASVLAFSAALLLILELDTPYGGIIEISDAPSRLALEQLGQ